MEKLTKKYAILLASQRFSFIASVKLPSREKKACDPIRLVI